MALSFSEKRGHQKVVDENLSTLEGGGLAFAAKRTAQKAMNDSLDALNAGVVQPPPDTYLPPGWTEASPGGLATNRDPIAGGIVDNELVSGEWFVIPENETIGKMTGFKTRKEAFDALAAAVVGQAVDPEPTTPQNQKLTDLLSGKYDDLQPEAYLKVVQDIITEINDVEPVKPAVLAYIQKAKDKGLITESAAMAAFEAILNGK